MGRRRFFRGALAATPVAAAAAVAAGIATAASHTTGHPRGERVAVDCGHAAPSLPARPPGPLLLHGAPPDSLASILGVFRQAPQGAGALPAKALPPGLSAVWIDHARLASREAGLRLYLIPGVARRPGIFSWPTVVGFTAGCTVRHAAGSGARREAEARLRRRGTVSIMVSFGAHALGYLGYPAASVTAGRAVFTFGAMRRLVVGVVPDGVASVTVTGAPATTVSAPVKSNVFLAMLPTEPGALITIDWLDASGAQIKAVALHNPPYATPAPIEQSPVIDVRPPASVRRAGPRAVARFKLGRAVLLRSGCLACHRLAGDGNDGPGPDLSHVGSRLSRRAIERVLAAPRPPMPSFKGLPRSQLKALAYFLSHLR